MGFILHGNAPTLEVCWNTNNDTPEVQITAQFGCTEITVGLSPDDVDTLIIELQRVARLARDEVK